MPFSSITFIFLFLPISLILFYIIPKKGWRNLILVGTSLVFFAWSDPAHIHVLFLSILFNYIIGIQLGSSKNFERKKRRKAYLWLGIFVNLFLLGFYKYTGFFLDIVETLFSLNVNLPQKALPLGISFFTFSGISYLVDIHNQVIHPEMNFIQFTSYLIMFPKLLQGPITRYTQIKNDFENHKFDSLELMEGARRFIGGLAKKVILADSLSIATNKIFSADFDKIGMSIAWFGLFAYTLQIYLDFSGYTDMAIGVGKMFGFKFPENFNFPYISKSISDFWRRWHITLGAWFRTYLFIPLEFSRKKVKVFRQQTNLLIVFLLTGFWHGASWNFIIWGLYYGLILVIESSGLNKVLKKTAPIIQHLYAFLLIMIGWVFFRIVSIQQWKPFFGALFGANGWRNLITFRSLNILFYIPFLIPSILFSLPYMNQLAMKIKERDDKLLILLDVGHLVLFLFTITFILSKGFTAFMYAEF